MEFEEYLILVLFGLFLLFLGISFCTWWYGRAPGKPTLPRRDSGDRTHDIATPPVQVRRPYARRADDQPSGTVKGLLIVQCPDPMMWYAGKVNKVIPYTKTDGDGHWSRDDDGFMNIVKLTDALIVDTIPTQAG